MKNKETRSASADNLRNPSRRQFMKQTAVAVVAAAGPAILSRNVFAAAAPINIGVLASLTGYLSDQAQNVVEGVQLAVDEINAKGGLLGRPIQVHVRDDEMKPPVGLRRFDELVKNQNIVFHTGVVFGPIFTALEQANKQLGDKAIVQFGVTTSNRLQSPKAMDPNLFFVGSPLEAFGLVAAEHMTKHVGKKTFMFYTDYSWGWDIRDGFLKSATINGTEVMEKIPMPPATTDFQPFLTQLMAKSPAPDFATCICNGMMFVNLMKQAYAMGLKDKMKFVTFHVNIEEVNGCGPEVIQDVTLVTDYFWNIQSAKNKEFLQKYFAKYGMAKRPSMRVFLHYVSVMMWAEAVRKAGTFETKAVSARLLGFKGDYGKGPVEIRKTGDHTTIQPITVARGKGPREMKDKFDTQEIVKLYTGEKYFYTPQEKGWV